MTGAQAVTLAFTLIGFGSVNAWVRELQRQNELLEEQNNMLWRELNDDGPDGGSKITLDSEQNVVEFRRRGA